MTTLEIPQLTRKGKNLELVSEKQVQHPDEKIKQKEAELSQVVVMINTAFKVLGSRTMTLLALFAGSLMFGYTVIDPQPLRISAACLFSVLVFLPLAYFDAKR